MNYNDFDKIEKFVYLVKGDAFLCNEIKNKFVESLNINSVNVTEFNEENFDVTNLINSCNQFSFFNEKRLVVVKDLQKELNASIKQTIQNYCDMPNNDCILLFIDTIGNNIFATLKNIEVIECKPNEKYLINFIVERFNKQGKTINTELAKTLIELCNANLNRINMETKKICDYLNEQPLVTAEIIDSLVSREIELKIFDLTTALGFKNKDKAIVLVNEMLALGESPIKIISLIASQFRRMFFAKINKGGDGELANVFGCKEYAIAKAREQSAKFSASQLKNIENLCMDIDFGIKNGDMTMENSLYYLIFNILNK